MVHEAEAVYHLPVTPPHTLLSRQQPLPQMPQMHASSSSYAQGHGNAHVMGPSTSYNSIQRSFSGPPGATGSSSSSGSAVASSSRSRPCPSPPQQEQQMFGSSQMFTNYS